MKYKKIRQLFNKRKKTARTHFEAGSLLDREIKEVYGFSFSETDDDRIIDTLDYGIAGISFEEFKDRMDRYKKSLEETGKFCVIP